MALCRWLRRELGVMDDATDEAGNYAADIADMGHHHALAMWLRSHASPHRSSAAALLGVDYDALCDLKDDDESRDSDDRGSCAITAHDALCNTN